MPRFPLLLCFAVALGITAPTQAQYGPDFTVHRQYDGDLTFGQLGKAVAGGSDLNGDGIPDYVIGSSQSDNGLIDAAGAVFAYSGKTGALIRTYQGTQVFELFGDQVADLGDINFDGIGDFVVTSGFYSPTFTGSSVQVISGADGSQLYFYDASGDYSNMGIALDSAGDVNADGVPDILIGESHADPLGTGKLGAAYVYSGLDGTPLHTFHGPAVNSGFGSSAKGAGDVNQDGYDDVVIGALNTTIGGFTFVGTAFVYSGFDGSVLHEWNGSAYLDNFGVSVSGVGDLNLDGYDDVAVGAAGNDSASPNAGAVFVYSGLTGLPLYTFQGVFQDFMGRSLDGPGDCNGDGIPDILIGSFGPGPSHDWAGRAWLYSGLDGSLLHQVTGSAAGDYMGQGISGVGDMNGDGAHEILIGAGRTHSGGVSDSGSAFLYGLNPHLFVNSDRLSNAAGSVLHISIDLPPAAAGYAYQTLMSVRGRGPTHYGINIPLTYDGYVLDSYHNTYPFSTHSGLHGILDPNGDASASITFPAGAYGFAVGRTFWLATIASPPGWAPEFSTGSVAITMLP